MGVLQDFERRLEGAVEGFFARAFRSGLQPVELAKAIQRYAEDHQQVTDSGVIVPNLYRFRVDSRDAERMQEFGGELTDELAGVVVRTADERGWTLRGPAVVRIEDSDDVRYGTYELAGRVEVVEGAQPQAPRPAPGGSRYRLRVVRPGGERELELTGARVVVGRLPDCDLYLDDPTVSRQHAAFVRRGDEWWVVDLGSTNGTRVNGRATSEQLLAPGDRVELSDAVVDFVED